MVPGDRTPPTVITTGYYGINRERGYPITLRTTYGRHDLSGGGAHARLSVRVRGFFFSYLFYTFGIIFKMFYGVIISLGVRYAYDNFQKNKAILLTLDFMDGCFFFLGVISTCYQYRFYFVRG